MKNQTQKKYYQENSSWDVDLNTYSVDSLQPNLDVFLNGLEQYLADNYLPSMRLRELPQGRYLVLGRLTGGKNTSPYAYGTYREYTALSSLETGEIFLLKVTNKTSSKVSDFPAIEPWDTGDTYEGSPIIGFQYPRSFMAVVS